MRSRLLWKYILLYILLAVATFVLISTLGSRLIERSLIRQESRRMYLEAKQIADERVGDFFRDEDALRNLYTNLRSLANYQNGTILILGPEGKIYLDTDSGYSADDAPVIEGFDPIALGSGYYSVGDFFGYFPEERLSVMVPLTSSLSIRGYAAVHRPMDQIYALRERVLAVVHIICWIVFGFTLLGLLFLVKNVLRPLKKITQGTEEFASGNLDFRIAQDSHDEMGDLAGSLNFMADEMHRTSEYQHTFLANVSHDFRSPLTSIKGYVEAMQDGTIPPEMQEKYLGIVLAETERLAKLTDGILTLNKMDGKGQAMYVTDFDIHAVIRDTAATFEGLCSPRRISIELLLTEGEHIVRADMSKIQQVLYNLIDNAIKFSADGSSIQIETTLRRDKVYVSVKDHGVGIPSRQIGKIWDRFYKADSSRGKERKGNGLGLAIVKEIIKEHGQNISVVSTEGVGTEFTFTLDSAG